MEQGIGRNLTKSLPTGLGQPRLKKQQKQGKGRVAGDPAGAYRRRSGSGNDRRKAILLGSFVVPWPQQAATMVACRSQLCLQCGAPRQAGEAAPSKSKRAKRA